MTRSMIDPNDPRATPAERAVLRRIANEIDRRSRAAPRQLPDSYREELDRMFGPADGDV